MDAVGIGLNTATENWNWNSDGCLDQQEGRSKYEGRDEVEGGKRRWSYSNGRVMRRASGYARARRNGRNVRREMKTKRLPGNGGAWRVASRDHGHVCLLPYLPLSCLRQLTITCAVGPELSALTPNSRLSRSRQRRVFCDLSQFPPPHQLAALSNDASASNCPPGHSAALQMFTVRPIRPITPPSSSIRDGRQ